MSPNQQLEVMNQIDEPASYGIGIENISIYFRASSKEKNGTVDFFVKPIFLKKQFKEKKKNRNFHFRFRPELIFFRQIELNSELTRRTLELYLLDLFNLILVKDKYIFSFKEFLNISKIYL